MATQVKLRNREAESLERTFSSHAIEIGQNFQNNFYSASLSGIQSCGKYFWKNWKIKQSLNFSISLLTENVFEMVARCCNEQK